MARGREERVLCFRDLADITMAIAALFIILSLVGFIMSIVVWTALLPAATDYMNHYNDPEQSGHDSATLVTSSCAAVLVVSLIGLVLSVVLLRAARARLRGPILVWLVFYALLFILLSALAVVSLVMACLAGPWPGIITAIIELFAAFVLWTWWAAVWAHWYTT
ncbi:hypothetical protein FJT64_005048 [Amphibalanus amphitrite]|uniref:Uncharacterized protein n=1 Tax=Amphibalanus amphitrite TaxID=1232801 RepID=A0A6A4VRY5_AMPAM|nr:hypothetical protein FJT64_005048 [Amphibalanus amphitrite]